MKKRASYRAPQAPSPGVEPGSNTANMASDACAIDGDSAGDKRVVLGIDVGGTATKVGLFDCRGALMIARTFASQDALSGGSYELFARGLVALLQEGGAASDNVAGVGLAVPGAVAPDGSLGLCPNLSLDLDALRAFLQAAFPQAILQVLNDSNAAALGDAWHGSTAGLAGLADGRMIMVTLGTGVGAGIVEGGVLFSGAHGLAGEIGHLCVQTVGGQPCSCGRTGCLEQYVSATALVRMARSAFIPTSNSAFAAAPDSGGTDAPRAAVCAFLDARSVLEAARRGDPAAQNAVERFATHLGFGLSQIACMLDPDIFVLGGGLSEAADCYLDDVRAAYRTCALPGCCDTPIVASCLGNACGIHGAAYCMLSALGVVSHLG